MQIKSWSELLFILHINFIGHNKPIESIETQRENLYRNSVSVTNYNCPHASSRRAIRIRFIWFTSKFLFALFEVRIRKIAQIFQTITARARFAENFVPDRRGLLLELAWKLHNFKPQLSSESKSAQQLFETKKNRRSESFTVKLNQK